MKTIFTILILSLVMTGCASKTKKEVKEKVEQSNVTSPQKLGQSIQETINSSEFLTAEQKKELEEIIAENKSQADALAAESFKHRSVLIQELLSQKADKRKIRVLKRSIKQIEDNKLKNTFETIEKITKVVSRNSDRENYNTPLLYIDRSFR